jgi:two-component system response regulator NreC
MLTMERDKKSIILADDHEIFLDSLTSMLTSEENLEVSVRVNNGKELVKAVQETRTDLCIVDMDMPEMNGMQASEVLLKLYPDLKILILTMHKEKSLIKKMISLGVRGYLLKTCDKEEFIFAINRILKGKNHFSEEVIETMTNEDKVETKLSPDLTKLAALSNREKEIICLLCNGLSNKQIAEKIFISPKTVDNHRTNIMRKLEVNNIVGLIRFAIKHGLAE